MDSDSNRGHHTCFLPAPLHFVVGVAVDNGQGRAVMKAARYNLGANKRFRHRRP